MHGTEIGEKGEKRRNEIGKKPQREVLGSVVRQVEKMKRIELSYHQT